MSACDQVFQEFLKQLAAEAVPPESLAVAFSGGMDSTSLLLHLLSKGYEVTAISFNYGQKHYTAKGDKLMASYLYHT